MAAAALCTGHVQNGVRPFDPYGDLDPVVDLITVAFGDRLDPAGRAALDEFRCVARRGWLWWLWLVCGRRAFASGFVWVEEGRVVGNVSLRRAAGRDSFFVGNVVVHPQWRGRGVASALVAAALERIATRGGRWVGLEVRADNRVARRLYDGLGFREVGRTLQMLRPEALPRSGGPLVHPSLRRGRRRDGPALIELMHAVIPERQRPLLESRTEDYRPRPTWTLARWLGRMRDAWWVVEEGDAICGAVHAVRGRGRRPHQLEVLVAPGQRGRFETVLVQKGISSLGGATKKMVETVLPSPTQPLVRALEAAGFDKLRVLIHMRLDLARRVLVEE